MYLIMDDFCTSNLIVMLRNFNFVMAWMIIHVPLCVCTGSIDMDLEGIIQCIKQGDENGVHTQLQQFNKEVMPLRHSHILVSG